MGDTESGNEGKVQSEPTGQPIQQSLSVGTSTRCVLKSQAYLEQALAEESSTDKNFYIRQALQLLQLEQSERPD